MRKITRLSAAIALATTAITSGCSSSSSSPAPSNPGNPDPVSKTTYSVAVSAPNSLGNQAQPAQAGVAQKVAYAVSGNDLSTDNFAVTVVDTAGNVVEVVEIAAEDITQNPDGTWEISVPGDPRLDCLIVVDINNPVTITAGNPLPDDVLFTPTTATDLEVDIASTAAYQNFLEEVADGSTFEQLGFDVDDPDAVAEIEALVEDVQQAFEDLVEEGLDPESFTSVDTLLAEIEETVADIVEAEVNSITNQVDGSVSEAVADGIYWVDSSLDDDSYLEYGKIDATTELQYAWDHGASEWEEDSYDSDKKDSFVLTSTGWQQTADFYRAEAQADGSVIISDLSVPSKQERITTDRVVDLSGTNMSTLLSITPNTAALGIVLDTALTFPAGAKMYEISFSATTPTYELYFDEGSVDACPYTELTPTTLNGNCDYARATSNGNDLGALTSLSALLSETAAADPMDATTVEIGGWGENTVVVAELINDQAKTVKYYLRDWSNETLTLLAQSTWSSETPNGLTEALYKLDLPSQVLNAAEFDEGSTSRILALHQGYVRLGEYRDTTSVETDKVFNKVAADAFLAALDVPALNAGQVTQTIVAGANPCNIESGWDDNAYAGFGGPAPFNIDNLLSGTAEGLGAIGAVSPLAFDVIVNTCRVAYLTNSEYQVGTAFTAADVAGKTFLDGDEALVFIDDTTMTWDGETFNWTINSKGYIEFSADFSFEDYGSEGLPDYGTISAKDTMALVTTSPNGEMQVRIHSTTSIWSTGDIAGEPVLDPSEGEVYSSTLVEQVENEGGEISIPL